jgi:hypothetical protein
MTGLHVDNISVKQKSPRLDGNVSRMRLIASLKNVTPVLH